MYTVDGGPVFRSAFVLNEEKGIEGVAGDCQKEKKERNSNLTVNISSRYSEQPTCNQKRKWLKPMNIGVVISFSSLSLTVLMSVYIRRE